MSPWLVSLVLHALVLGIGPCVPLLDEVPVEVDRLELVMLATELPDLLGTPLDPRRQPDQPMDLAAERPADAGANSADTLPTTGGDDRPDRNTPGAASADGEPRTRAEMRARSADAATPPPPVSERRADGLPEPEPEPEPEPNPAKEPEPEPDRYVHAPDGQDEAHTSEANAVSSEDRQTDRERRTSVLASDEGEYAPFAEAGQKGRIASEKPEEEGQARDSTETEQQAAAIQARQGTEAVDGPRDAQVRGQGASEVVIGAEESSGEDVDGARTEAVPVTEIPEWAAGLPTLPEDGEDAPLLDTPEWWEAGAQRPAAPAGGVPVEARDGRVGRVALPPSPEQSTGGEDGTADALELRQGHVESESDEGDPSGDADSVVAPTEPSEGEDPEVAVTEVFRQSMGWRSGGAPGHSTSGSPSASQHVATEHEADAVDAQVNAKKTPRGVYAGHVERALMENWHAKDLTVEQRTLGARGEVTVLFRIRKSGRVADLVLTRSSGDAHIDHLALRAVPKRFARFPSDLHERFLIFEWTFHYRN